MFFDYPLDENTYKLSYQFKWGPSIMVIPVTEPNVDKVNGYLPPTVEWYSLYGNNYGQLISNTTREFDAPRNSTAPVFVQGGSIIPKQTPKLTLTETHEQNFQLLIVCSKFRIII